MKTNIPVGMASALLERRIVTQVETTEIKSDSGEVVYSSTTTTTTTLKDVKDLTKPKKKRRRVHGKYVVCVCKTYANGTVEYDRQSQYAQFQKIAQERSKLIESVLELGVKDLTIVDRVLRDKGYKGLTFAEIHQLLG